jgi:hypothetical protein
MAKIEHLIALGFLGVAGILFLTRGSETNAAWALGAMAGYAFKNGYNYSKNHRK